MSDDLSRDDAMQIAMKFCGYRERSKKEVEDKLIAKSFNQKIIKVCIERLVELDYLNNIRFSKSFSRGKNKFSSPSIELIPIVVILQDSFGLLKVEVIAFVFLKTSSM